MDKVPFVSQNPCSNFIYLVYVSNSIVKKYDNRVKKNPPYYYNISNIHQKALAFIQMIPLLNQKHSYQGLRLGVQEPEGCSEIQCLVTQNVILRF